MKKWAYYNEWDAYSAQWIRNLIKAGHIADGEVDERSIEDVHPDDIRGFCQVHMFAGIAVWSHALRSAGWHDDRPVWTGSCPCQPFSAAGQGAGFADERHLWPAFGHLIAQCKPAIIFGEQVASKDVDAWIDLVHADLEALGYAFGSVPFPSAGVGAPHIRDRNYWMANAAGIGQPRGRLNNGSEQPRSGIEKAVGSGLRKQAAQRSPDDRVADAECSRVCRKSGDVCSSQTSAGDRQHMHDSVAGGHVRSLADTSGERRFGRQGISAGSIDGGADAGRIEGDHGLVGVREAGLSRVDGPGPTNGFWRDADWLGCTDGKWRPVGPGTFPLAAGIRGRVGRVRTDWHAPAGKEDQGHRTGRLKGFGNAINAGAAIAFIEAAMESA